MMIRMQITACLALCLLGCADPPDRNMPPSPKMIARLEQSITTLEPGMSEQDALKHIRFETFEPFFRNARASGHSTHEYTDYVLSGSAGILSLIHGKEGLKHIQFWNKQTGTKTKSKLLKPTTESNATSGKPR